MLSALLLAASGDVHIHVVSSGELLDISVEHQVTNVIFICGKMVLSVIIISAKN